MIDIYATHESGHNVGFVLLTSFEEFVVHFFHDCALTTPIFIRWGDVTISVARTDTFGEGSMKNDYGRNSGA